ncbi:MAG: xanthine dehydrogenase family protein molybdopterin-binding subunit [Spirochaetes bacterium]|nr:xanthine dehydrogenase family protein molybdopterin-binding subunit [Spirochaetota bacterium]MBU1082007.1 xanthine dehydrogenase family protein molybdopterin-binding subunit [Spirochaetota bacterium]
MSQAYKPRVPRKFVGGYRPKIDGPDKASGRALYADDMTIKSRFPDMLYAKILRSPYPNARIRKFDLSKAEALPGVVSIMTYEDPEFKSLKLTNAGWTDCVDTVSWDRMMFQFRDRRVLGEYACWVGDEMGIAVAAETEEIADEALGLIDIDWETSPFVLDPLEAMKKGAPLVHPDIQETNVLAPDPTGGPDVFEDRGDVEEDFKRAEFVVEGESVFHNATQGSMDNWCCLMQWKADQLTVWSNHYAADQLRMHIKEMLGLPLHKIRAIASYVGGQFGRGDTGDQPFFLVTSLLAMRTGRPVKYRHTRHQSFLNTRQPAIYTFKAGAKRDGTITSLHFKSIGNVGAYADLSMFALKFVPKELAEVFMAHIPNLRMESYGVYTNVIPGCMMRGVGNSQFNLVFAHVMDAVAERLGMDPIDLCIKNFAHEWEKLPSESLVAVLNEGAERLGWKDKRHLPGKGRAYDGVKRRGVGFSCHPSWHAEWQEKRRGKVQVNLTLNPDCTVLLNAATIEVGGGSNTCNVLGCAEALGFLGIGVEDIHWTSITDTNDGIKDCVQTDSAVSFLQAEVMIDSAKELKLRLREAGAEILNVKASDIDIVEGEVIVASRPDLRMTVKQMLHKGDNAPITVAKSRSPDVALTGVPFFANFAEVEVDTSTGKVDVLRLVVVNDCGTVMYASGAESQQIGGQCMGMGEALTEEIIYDKATGIPLNFNWVDYTIPTMADMPDIDPVLLEVWKGTGEYGACGIGEGTVSCTPGAILNAIYNAIGVRVNDIPIKPEKILKALGKD